MLTQTTIPFLNKLADNNNKEWFNKNKEWYKLALNDFTIFTDQVINLLSKVDTKLVGLKAKDCIYRIYRDVRFSKDKTPYKTHFGANISPGGRKSKLAGFYLHIEPTGQSIAGGGIYMPEPQALKALRNEFYQVPEELLEIIENQVFKKYFGGLWENNKLKTAPKGFPKDFAHIELLKHKSFVATNEISSEILHGDSLNNYLVKVFEALYPMNRLINTIIEDANAHDIA